MNKIKIIFKNFKRFISNPTDDTLIIVDKINELIKLRNKTLADNKKLRIDMRTDPNGIYNWEKYEDMISDPKYKKWKSDILNNDKSLIKISSELEELNSEIFTNRKKL